MKFTQTGRIALASILSLAACLGISACTTAHTVAFLYVPTSKSNPGGIDGFKIDSQSGALTPLTGSPYPAGANPLRVIVSPDSAHIYIINHDDSTIGAYNIGSDGSLALVKTYPVVGTLPTSIAIDPKGKYLVVSVTYQPGFSAANPGPGALNVFPVAADGTIGTIVSNGSSNFAPIGCNPIGVNVTALNNFVYVVDQNFTPSPAACAQPAGPATSPISNQPLVLAFQLDLASGALTAIPGSPNTVLGVAAGALAGVQPSAIVSEPMARYVYVTDQASNQLIGYTVQANGSLVPMVDGPFSTGFYPVGATVDPRGKFLYVANYNGGTISSYALNLATGTPSGVSSLSQTPVQAGPTCVTVEPALGQFLFASNFLDNSVAAELVDTHSGGLTVVPNSPFPTAGQPTCAVAVGSGAHPVQTITP